MIDHPLDREEVRRAWLANPQFRTAREHDLIDRAAKAWLDSIELPAPTQAESYDAPTGVEVDHVRQIAENLEHHIMFTIDQDLLVAAALRDWLRLRFQADDDVHAELSRCFDIAQRLDARAPEAPGAFIGSVSERIARHLCQPGVQAQVIRKSVRPPLTVEFDDDDVQAQPEHDCEWRRDADARAEDKVLHLSDVQAQVDAAVADCERRCATQLADYISRAADDERVRIDAALAVDWEQRAEALIAATWPALNPVANTLRECANQIRARSAQEER